jgi:hypothetical protein
MIMAVEKDKKNHFIRQFSRGPKTVKLRLRSFVPKSSNECAGCGCQTPSNSLYVACASKTLLKDKGGNTLNSYLNEIKPWNIKLCNDCLRSIHRIELAENVLPIFIVFIVSLLVSLGGWAIFSYECKNQIGPFNPSFSYSRNSQETVRNDVIRAIEKFQKVRGVLAAICLAILMLAGMIAFAVSLIYLIITSVKRFRFNIIGREPKFAALFRWKAQCMLPLLSSDSIFVLPHFVDWSKYKLTSEQLDNISKEISSGAISSVDTREILLHTGHSIDELCKHMTEEDKEAFERTKKIKKNTSESHPNLFNK